MPVSAFRLKSRKGWPAARVLGMVKLPSMPGMVPFRPSPFSVNCKAPPIIVVAVHEAASERQTTPVHDLPATGELLFWPAYGGHGCSPVRQFSKTLLGSRPGAAGCRMVYKGTVIPRLVPSAQPVLVAVAADAGYELLLLIHPRGERVEGQDPYKAGLYAAASQPVERLV